MLPKPICSRNEYEMALREMEVYFEREPEPGSPQAARFDELLRRVENFEAAHYVIECPGCGEIRLELHENHVSANDNHNSVTEQVLAEFCQGCASHLNDQSWQVSDGSVSTWVAGSTGTKHTPQIRNKG
jgi:HTH-type transcriptional regulator/antitoxin HigA